MADFARMPTRQKVMVFAVIGLLIGLLYYQFVFKGLKSDLETVEAENASKIQTNARLERDIPDFERLKAEYDILDRQIKENQKALPTEAELPAFFETLNRKVRESGVEVVRSRQLAEDRVERFLRVPVEYEIVGTYVQIKKFFASLVPKRKRAEQAEPLPGAENEVQEQERIVSIENLSLTNPTVRNREIQLTARFVASTYRMEDGAAQPAPKKAAAGAAGSTAPKATPAGAKAATDAALDKADQRNEDAKKSPAAAGVDRLKGGI